MGIPEHLTCLLRNLHLGQGATATRRARFTPWVGKILWRRKWQFTPVLLPGKSCGLRSLVGYSPEGWKESDMTERLNFHFHAVKGFGVVNKAEIDVFLEFSCFFYDTMDVGNLISGSSAFSKSILNIWKFSVHVLLKPNLENFEH